MGSLLISSLIIVLLYFGQCLFAASVGGDWETFRDETNTKLANLEIRSEKTNKIIDNFFSDKWDNFKTFQENNARKALIYPYKTESSVSITRAIEICKQNGASLVEIKSLDKQKLVESFIHQIYYRAEFTYRDFWLNLNQSVSDSGNYKWLSNGNEVAYNNWWSDEPKTNYPYVTISNYKEPSQLKWFTKPSYYLCDFICEFEL